MFNITSPNKAGFGRRRGRPKQIKSEGATPEFLQKQRRIRDILGKTTSSVVFSWLHISYHAGIISQELFDLGGQYLKFRMQVRRHQQNRALKLNCHVLAKSRGRSVCQAQEEEDAKAEENWQELIYLIPSFVTDCLDELLFENISYDLSTDQITTNRKRLKESLLILNDYKDTF